MRLIDTATLLMEELGGDNIPPYAILSHTWGDDEFKYEHMKEGVGQEKSGYAKIRGCVKLAAARKHKYVWIDTCCESKKRLPYIRAISDEHSRYRQTQ